jgi:predicted extracellular nuclease
LNARSYRLVLGFVLLLAFVGGGGAAKAASPTELFFSEYIEGSSNNKAVEIYNGTGAAIDLSTQGYNLQMFFNGSATAGLTINLTGSVAHGDVHVVAQSAANAAILAQADQTNGSGWFNGDDAVVLRRGTTVLDVIGQIGIDPGTQWGADLTSTADNTIRRKPTVIGGDANGTDGFDPATEWDGFATDDSTGLGAHVINTGGDAAPAVTDSEPDNGDVDVPLDANVSVTFSEEVTASAGAFSISCSASGLHTFAFSSDSTSASLDPDADFVQAETCTVTVDKNGVSDVDPDDPPDTMSANHVFSFTTVAPTRRIYEIQGASHTSPYAGQLVSAVPGVITAVRPNSLYIQDAIGDGNVATSDAILVFRNGVGAGFTAGQAVLVSGRVTEFRQGGAASPNLTTTEIITPTVTPAGPGAAIAETVVGQGGRVPPTTVIEDDAGGNVETGGVFDPATDGIDFYESLEAMLLRVNNPVVVGPRNDFGEVWVLADRGAGAGTRTDRGGIVIRKLGSALYPNDYARGDFNPERIQLDDEILTGATPAVNVGDRLTSAAVGVLDYSFGNFEVLLTSALTRVDRGLKREVTRAQRRGELAVATFNVENLDPTDPPAKFAALAGLIVNNLRAPDLLAIEEIQDNTGPAATDPSTDASVTWQMLIAAIETAGGPTYDYRQIDPLFNQDGGEPGGNIRVGFLFRTDRGLSFVDRPGGTAVNATHENTTAPGAQLTLSPGRIDPTSTAFTSSRKPLAAEFRWRGKTFFAVANHFNSKGGDHPLYGRFQPPLRSSETQRHQQAAIVNSFVDELLAADKRARVIVLGDINDFEFSSTTAILEGGVLTSLVDTLPRDERYTYVFEGNSQVLDQILVSKALFSRDDDEDIQYDVVHVNAEFATQDSDHDPSVMRTRFGGDDD